MSKLYMECRDFIKDNGVYYNNVSILKSGRITNIYFNIKECIVKDSYFTSSILHLIDSKFKDNEVDYNTVVGVELGGTLIADRFIEFKHSHNRMSNNESLNYLVCRKETKYHGLNNLVIGDIEKAKDVVIIEDVITSGESIMNAIFNIKQIKNKIENVKAVICVVDRTNWFYNDGNDLFKRYLDYHNCKFLPLYRQEDFVI